jgi:methionyl-tRNA formyltransferase
MALQQKRAANNLKNSIVFFGTPDFAAQVLEYLIEQGVEIKAVVTQPDRPKGRSLQLTSSPVKMVAEKKKLPIFQPPKCSNPEFLAELKALDADLYVVVAFGQILPISLLQIPRLGCINVHASLLPKLRGAAPIQRAILNGDQETGIAIQKMVKELDAGDVIAEERIAIEEMTFGELEHALCGISKSLLIKVLHMYEQGVPEARAQDHAAATYAPKIRPEEGEIHWNQPVDEILHLIRAFSPRPGAWCMVESNGEKKRLKVLKARKADSKNGLIVGEIELIEVQPEGKPKMAASDWKRGVKSLVFS